jgi:hypothetical protein
MMSELKLLFPLAPDEDGYPPVAVESVWASRRGAYYQIDNIPFFTRDATFEDIVEATERDGALWFVRVVEPARNSLLRVVYFDGANPEHIRDELQRLGCATEWMDQYHLVAVHVPSLVNIDYVLRYLIAEQEKELIDYEEAMLWHES